MAVLNRLIITYDHTGLRRRMKNTRKMKRRLFFNSLLFKILNYKRIN